jgi:hypothetical protein
MNPVPQPNGAEKRVSVDQTSEIVCENCSGKIFTEGVLLRKVSRFITGDSHDSLIPVPVIYCVKCHHINKDMLDPRLNVENNESSQSL